MSDTTHRVGSGGLPPSNILAGNTYNPLVGATAGHPDGFPPGTPVVQSLAADGTVIPGRANAAATSSVTGLVILPAVVGDHALTQFHGVLHLTTAQWDAVTGDSGGLTPNAQYFLSASPEGRLTKIAPSAGGTFAIQVGVGLSPNDLMIQICAPEAN